MSGCEETVSSGCNELSVISRSWSEREIVLVSISASNKHQCHRRRWAQDRFVPILCSWTLHEN